MQAFVKLAYQNVNLSSLHVWYVSCILNSETRKKVSKDRVLMIKKIIRR